MKRVLCAAILAAALFLCAAAPALADAVADPLPPVDSPTEQMSAGALELASGGASSDEPSGEPSGEASSEEPSAETEEETLLPIVPGEYESPDGSVLKVREDGSCTYETVVSGTVNGRVMSGRLTFHGTVDNGDFTFTKVTFFGLDLTKAAENAGYTDASYWEDEAGLLYAGALEP